MSSYIDISVQWFDEDLIELKIGASNGRFAGEVSVYADRQAVQSFASAISGFPTALSDTRHYELGTFDPEYAGGGARFNFRCIDSVGHAVVDVQLRGDPRRLDGNNETAAFPINIEASVIDSFVRALEKVEVRRGANALLIAA